VRRPAIFPIPPATKSLPATFSVSLHKHTHASYYILPGVPCLFKFAQFGICWIRVRCSPSYSGKFLVHRAERAGKCVSRRISLFTKLLPLKANLVWLMSMLLRWRPIIGLRHEPRRQPSGSASMTYASNVRVTPRASSTPAQCGPARRSAVSASPSPPPPACVCSIRRNTNAIAAPQFRA